MKRRAFLSSRSSFRLTPLCTIQSVDYQNLKTPKEEEKEVLKKHKTRWSWQIQKAKGAAVDSLD